MILHNATDVRRNWSEVTGNVIREKPQFIKRTRDCMVLTDVKLFENLLEIYHMTADKFVEDDSSITLSLWSAAPNRKSHIPYVLKALIINDAVMIGEAIECQEVTGNINKNL